MHAGNNAYRNLTLRKARLEKIIHIPCILFHPPLGEQSAFSCSDLVMLDGETDPSQQFLPLHGLTLVHIHSPAAQAAHQPFHTSQPPACGGDLTWAPWPHGLLGVSSSILPVLVCQEPELLVWFLAIGRAPERITLLSGICAASHEDPGAELLL